MAPSLTPTIDNFLIELSRILREKDGGQLQDYLVIEPPLPQTYTTMVSELRQSFPAEKDSALETKCERSLPEAEIDGETGGSWSGFLRFVKLYFAFLRDVNIQNLLETQELLADLVSQSISALGHGGLGLVMLPTVISFSRTLARLTVGLDNRPELTAQWARRKSVGGGDDGEARLNIVEDTAEKIREGFKTCLNARTSGRGVTREGRPEGKKIGIYLMANLCLKLYFQCRKTANATQIFTNIPNQSPPLSIYPASQRITYLYYLGRFLFSNNHFYRAQHVLQAAYDQCHAKCTQQRRRIVIHLITTNIILGRFPSRTFLQRPEAEGLGEIFLPVCTAMAKGDLARFRQIFSSDTKSTDWLLKRGIFLPMRNRCEVLVWRSLARRTFVISGFHGEETSKRAANLDIQQLRHLAVFLERLVATQPGQSIGLTNGAIQHTNSIFIFDNRPGYVDPDLEGVATPSGPLLPDIVEVESILSSLISQGLLTGYISHKLSKFVILGAAKHANGAVGAGFPNVWETLRSRSDELVPGWVLDEQAAPAHFMGRRVGPGMVVNLSGARPAGAGPM